MKGLGFRGVGFRVEGVGISARSSGNSPVATLRAYGPKLSKPSTVTYYLQSPL